MTFEQPPTPFTNEQLVEKSKSKIKLQTTTTPLYK
jgi:hypothetical protein